MTNSNYTTKCIEFSKHFKGKQGVTTHQNDNEENHYFSGAVYINGREFVCLDEIKPHTYIVYINNPDGYEGKQLIFGEYKTFGKALKKTESIVDRRKYPKPILIW